MILKYDKIYDLFLINYFTVRTISMFRFKIQSVLRNVLLLRLWMFANTQTAKSLSSNKNVLFAGKRLTFKVIL